ncbi:helix-turn-helix domain-containing protein [Pelomonas sp. KK5]|uniref:helix-turn-helix domain-containing protein n=1 Tax=Pelomonas sp. KK5 TaxID=1855730 RepID=UPI001301B54A|nr:helix-turn-helix domain-containing protein [Pelomonas sp. KK5]
MKRLMLERPDLLRQMIQALVSDSPGLQQLHKLHCVLLVGEGCSCCEVGRWFGHSTRTVERWFGVYVLRGAQGLRPRRTGGRHPLLPAEVAQGLHEELRRPPAGAEGVGIAWSGALLKQHLLARHGIALSLRQCQRLLQQEARAPGLLPG